MTDEEQIDFETAFIIIKGFDGTYHAISELGSAFTVERTANRADMHRACQELLGMMDAERVADAVLAKMGQNDPENSQRKVDAIRQSLVNRNIL